MPAGKGSSVTEEIILFPTHLQAAAYRKRQAQSGAQATFGLHFETLESWLGNAWDRFGDGRRIVSSVQRQLILYQLIKNSEDLSEIFGVEDLNLPESEALQLDGFVSGSYTDSHAYLGSLSRAAASFILNAAGSLELSAVLEGAPSNLAPREKGMLDLASQYFTFLELHNAIEIGDACAALFETNYSCQVSLGQLFDLPYGVEQRLVMSGVLDMPESNQTAITPAPEGVRVDLVFPAGPSAEDAAMVQSISGDLEAMPQADILVVTNRAFETNAALTRGLDLTKVKVSIHANKPFFLTDFGRAYHGLFDFILNSDHSKRALQDYFASSFAGISQDQASKVDSLMRGNRALGYEDLRALARLYSPHFDTFEELFTSTDAAIVLGYFEDVALSIPHVDEAYRAEQLSAIAALRSVYEQARDFTSKPSEIIALLESVSVIVGAEAGSGRAHVYVCDTNNSEVLGCRPFDAVYLCDLDSQAYSATNSHSAVLTLQDKIGIPVADTSIERRRRWFEERKNSATQKFVCERSLRNGDSVETYPSFLFDEFLKASRGDEDALDAYGLPVSLNVGVATRNEDEFTANLSALTTGSNDAISVDPAPSFALASKQADNLFPSYMVAEDGKLILSPSAIEAYINCPYSWFAMSLLRPEPCDEGFGPLERGTFAHSVLERFYEHLQNKLRFDRLTPEILPMAQKVFDDIYDQVLSEQLSKEGTRFVPQTPTEFASAKRLKATMRESLTYQADFLPSFVPAASELAINPVDKIEYAGVYLRGRVDRIDMEKGSDHFVVVDYKGSLIGHNAGLKEKQFDALEDGKIDLPHKVQALIYAQALKQKLKGSAPMGALYMNYKASDSSQFLAGSVSKMLIDECQAKGTSNVEINFETYLDLVEAAVAPHLEKLKAGIIEPAPLHKSSCAFCTVANCPRRLS